MRRQFFGSVGFFLGQGQRSLGRHTILTHFVFGAKPFVAY
jgi:hypothetical protein